MQIHIENIVHIYMPFVIWVLDPPSMQVMGVAFKIFTTHMAQGMAQTSADQNRSHCSLEQSPLLYHRLTL